MEKNKLDLKVQYEKKGYVFLSGLLSCDEAKEYRKKLQSFFKKNDEDFTSAFAKKGGVSKPDGVTTTPEFWPIIFHPRLLKTVREILGSDARYTQHSDLHVHNGMVGWHRDSKDRIYGIGSDWDTTRVPYAVIRVAIYLQSFMESGFKLGVIPGTHSCQSKLRILEEKLWTKVHFKIPQPQFIDPVLTMPTKWFKLEPGDCIIFQQRLMHCGSRIRGPKYAIYLSYGLDNEHSRNHMRFYREERTKFKYGPIPEELKQKLIAENLYLPYP